MTSKSSLCSAEEVTRIRYVADDENSNVDSDFGGVIVDREEAGRSEGRGQMRREEDFFCHRVEVVVIVVLGYFNIYHLQVFFSTLCFC